MTNFEALKVCIEYLKKNFPDYAEDSKLNEAVNQTDHLIEEIEIELQDVNYRIQLIADTFKKRDEKLKERE